MTFKRRLARLPGAPALRRALGQAPRRPEPTDYHRPILSLAEGSELIHSLLSESRSALVARGGCVEMACLMHYLRRRDGRRQPYPGSMLHAMSNNAGFFSPSDDALDMFAREYIAAMALADAMGVWFNVGEDQVARECCPDSELIPLRSIEPYYGDAPWTSGLRGRRVLVIHPFAQSIREQYENKRESLFDSPEVLPQFDLHVIKAIQSAAGEVPAFGTWFDALESMKSAMDAIEYDVCIVGAGAYGLPLAAHAKKSGRLGIHMGGATQILFGIKGKRWDDHEVISRLYRDSWIRPKSCEAPRNSMAVEGGCYW